MIRKGFRYIFFYSTTFVFNVLGKIIRGANIRGFLVLHVKCLCTKIHSTPCMYKEHNKPHSTAILVMDEFNIGKPHK
jgi:hypothetical protein